MPCFYPIAAWRSEGSEILFRPVADACQIRLPCGRCVGCRLERSRQWAVRLMHELRYHEDSSFITLTFADDHLPVPPTLDVKVFQDFMKRLRKELYPRKIRFFHCGEYGEKFGRPHYHAIIFGESFIGDRYALETSKRGDVTWSSPVLDRLWPFGMSRIGSVTFESCAYVARYVTKKVTGDLANEYYQWIEGSTGEVFKLRPEYATMSRRPGIGASHYHDYFKEIFPSDEVISRGFKSKPPNYYVKLLEKQDAPLYELVKEARTCALELSDPRLRSPYTLNAKERATKLKLGAIQRRYENGN